MDLESVIVELNDLLAEKNPESFNSSWILKHAPHCYRFIWKNVRTEFNSVDWDRVTYALEWKYQRRWAPGRKRKNPTSYTDSGEVDLILNKYRDKLYVFIAPADMVDRRVRDIIAVTLVRIAQAGNLTAKEELMKLVRYTIDDWLEKYYFLSRWKGYDDAIQDQLAACIRRYRYTGSFLNYVYRTLEYAGRGIRSFSAYSLDEPVAFDADKRKAEDVVQDSETQEIQIYSRH
jgi:hypothetical protein